MVCNEWMREREPARAGVKCFMLYSLGESWYVVESSNLREIPAKALILKGLGRGVVAPTHAPPHAAAPEAHNQSRTATVYFLPTPLHLSWAPSY
jgi:hypothetical protein